MEPLHLKISAVKPPAVELPTAFWYEIVILVHFLSQKSPSASKDLFCCCSLLETSLLVSFHIKLWYFMHNAHDTQSLMNFQYHFKNLLKISYGDLRPKILSGWFLYFLSLFESLLIISDYSKQLIWLTGEWWYNMS